MNVKSQTVVAMSIYNVRIWDGIQSQVTAACRFVQSKYRQVAEKCCADCTTCIGCAVVVSLAYFIKPKDRRLCGTHQLLKANTQVCTVTLCRCRPAMGDQLVEVHQAPERSV